MKKICFLSPKAYPLFNNKIHAPLGGGTEVQLYLLARELSSYPDVEVSFIVANDGEPAQETYENIDIFKSFQFKDILIKRISDFYKTMRKVDADIYIQSTLTAFSGMIALLCRLRGKKFVYRLASDSEVDGRYEQERGVFIDYISKFVFKFAHLVIVQNAGQQEVLLGRKVKNISLLRSGMDANDSVVQKEDFVLWVGRSVETKRPELFIQLAKQIPEIRFVMILSGNPDNRLHQIIKNKCKEVLNLELHESLSFNETKGYFQKARIFISTSDMEGFPMVFLQAAANRTPIVSLYVDPEGILSERKCGLFSQGNFFLLKGQVSELLRDGNLYQELAENGHNFIQENCAITRITKQLHEKLMKL